MKARLTLLLAFNFLLFEIGGIKSSSIVVSREIKIKGIFYTCLTKQLSTFLQLTAHSSFFPQPQLNQTEPKNTGTDRRDEPLLDPDRALAGLVWLVTHSHSAATASMQRRTRGRDEWVLDHVMD